MQSYWTLKFTSGVSCHETNHKFYHAIHPARLVQMPSQGSCPFLSVTARRKKPKKLISSDWAETLAESNKGLLLRPGAMVEGVERTAKRRMRPASSKIGNGEWRNGERGTGNGERGTGNGESLKGGISKMGNL